jgi:hypothetical protein
MPKMKMAPLPSLDKEGQAAAGGCCRGGWKPLKPGSRTTSNHPRWAVAQHPLLIEEGSYFRRSDREAENVGLFGYFSPTSFESLVWISSTF